jgi:hypothetical protein
MPALSRRTTFFFIPVVGILWVVGLDRLLRGRSKGLPREVAALFGIIGFAIMNLAAVVQNSIHILTRQDAPQAAGDLAEWVRRSVNSIQLGMDVSFDIFGLLSFALFALAMPRHPVFGPCWGIPGGLLAIATLLLNLHAFPIPPEPGLGPAVALWLAAVSVRMVIAARAPGAPT